MHKIQKRKERKQYKARKKNVLSDQSSIGVHVGHWHVQTINMTYYMALSHKDWELPNSWIWLAETDIDRGLDFPIYTGIQADNVLQ